MATDNDKITLDYAAFLADLEAKSGALDQLIASLRAVMAAGALTTSGSGPFVPLGDLMRTGAPGGEIPTGAFLGKSIPEAAKLCLQIVKRKMTTREIADALLKGGIETTSKNFPTILYTILFRASHAGMGIVKLDKHWALADWYPAAMRTAQPQEKRKTATKRASKAKSKAKAKEQQPIEKAVEPSPQQPVQERIVQALRSKPEITAQDIASSVGARIQTVHLVLAKLVNQKRAEKTAGGKFKAMAA